MKVVKQMEKDKVQNTQETNTEDELMIMSFKDEDGNKIDFEVVAKIYLEEQEYLILAPVDENSEDEYVFRVDEIDGAVEFNAVDDDAEFLAVKKEYNSLRY